MIERLHIQGFRSLEDVVLSELGQFNLLVGPGNSGKTNLLEAIFLFCSTGDPTLLGAVLGLRRVAVAGLTPRETVAHFDWFWSRARDSSSETHDDAPAHAETAEQSERGSRFTIHGDWKTTHRAVTVWKVPQDSRIPVKMVEEEGVNGADVQPTLATYKIETRGADGSSLGEMLVTPKAVHMQKPAGRDIPARFLSPLEQGQSGSLAPAWTEAEDRHEDQDIVKLLQLFDPRIMAVRIVSDELRRAALRIQHERLGRVPIESLGSGFGKALAIACHVCAIKNGVFVVDEIDASLDIGAQTKIIEFFMRAAERHKVQVFASTHSIETVDAFLEAYANMTKENLFKDSAGLRILQVAQSEGRTVVKSIPAEQAKRLREDLGFDLRRTE